MWNEFVAFLLFLSITIFSWIISYSDFEELLICYGCYKLEPSYDFVIVGGGTAGCALASRLAENRSASILIVEAGGRANSLLSIPIITPMLQQSNFDWKYTTTRQTGACLSFDKQRCKFPLGKILGGSHQLNFMIYTRGHPEDYDPWFKDLPGYSYEKDVEEYFGRVEKMYQMNETVINTSTPATISPSRYFSLVSSFIFTAFGKLGHATSRPTAAYRAGFFRPLVTQKNGRRWTTADYLLDQKLPNVHILTKAKAEKILFKDGVDATGVRVDYLGERVIVNAKRAVVLSAGTVGSAKLLMLSGVGPKEHLSKVGIDVVKNLPVGNNLQDHLVTGFDLLKIEDGLGISIKDIIHPASIYRYLVDGEGPWTCSGVDLIGFINIDFMRCKNCIKNNITTCFQRFSQSRPDVELMMLPLGLGADQGIHLRTLFGITDELWDSYFGKTNGSTMSILPMLLHPRSRGTVRLANKNPNSKPLIDPNYLSHPNDLKELLNYIIQVRKLVDMSSKGNPGIRLNEMKYPGCEKIEFGTLCYWECYLRRLSHGCYHPIGTCKMGVGNDSVVDFDFKVHGLNKLFVVDGSVFPSHISGHTNGPVIMMAERASDVLKRYQYFDVGKTKGREGVVKN